MFVPETGENSVAFQLQIHELLDKSSVDAWVSLVRVLFKVLGEGAFSGPGATDSRRTYTIPGTGLPGSGLETIQWTAEDSEAPQLKVPELGQKLCSEIQKLAALQTPSTEEAQRCQQLRCLSNNLNNLLRADAHLTKLTEDQKRQLEELQALQVQADTQFTNLAEDQKRQLKELQEFQEQQELVDLQAELTLKLPSKQTARLDDVLEYVKHTLAGALKFEGDDRVRLSLSLLLRLCARCFENLTHENLLTPLFSVRCPPTHR